MGNIDEEEYEKIKLTILRKMLRHEYIGGKHTSMKNIPKGFPKKERNKVLIVFNRMKKEGYFIIRKKRDLHVSLNPKMLPKIIKELKKAED